MASPGNQHYANCVAAHFRSLSVFADSLQLTVGCTESSGFSAHAVLQVSLLLTGCSACLSHISLNIQLTIPTLRSVQLADVKCILVA